MALTAEQAAARRDGLGGSDIAAIIGESPYRRPIDVWLDKRGEAANDFAGNERTRWGDVLEPVVAGEYAHREGARLLVAAPKTWVHPEHSWLRGSPDFLACAEGALAGLGEEITRGTFARARLNSDAWGVEIKTHGFRAGSAYSGGEGEVVADDDSIPPHIRVQCAWYQALTGADRWDLAALIDTSNLRTYRIPRDAELEAYLLEEAERFWKRNVLGGVAPEPDGSPSFARYLKQRFAAHSAEIVDAGADVDSLLAEYRDARDAEKAAKAAKDMAAQRIQAAIGEDLGVKTDGGRATWKEQRGRIDYRRMCEELAEQFSVEPDALAELGDNCRGKSIRVLRVK
jgi:putative phage-type endonuclease